MPYASHRFYMKPHQRDVMKLRKIQDVRAPTPLYSSGIRRYTFRSRPAIGKRALARDFIKFEEYPNQL